MYGILIYYAKYAKFTSELFNFHILIYNAKYAKFLKWIDISNMPNLQVNWHFNNAKLTGVLVCVLPWFCFHVSVQNLCMYLKVDAYTRYSLLFRKLSFWACLKTRRVTKRDALVLGTLLYTFRSNLTPLYFSTATRLFFKDDWLHVTGEGVNQWIYPSISSTYCTNRE